MITGSGFHNSMVVTVSPDESATAANFGLGAMLSLTSVLVSS